MSTSILWFHRDLRLADHPALLAALESSLAALSADTDGALVVRTGEPAEVIAALAAEVGAREVHVSRESTP